MSFLELPMRFNHYKTDLVKNGYYRYFRKVVLKIKYVKGSVAEWSKALVLGTSLCVGKGSNPFTIKID